MATSGSYLTSKVVNSMTGDGCPDRANISWSASWNPATLQWTVAWSANGAGYYNNNYVTIFSGTVTVKDQNGNVIQTKSMAGQIAQARKDVQLIADSFTLGVDTYGNQSLQFSAVFRIGYNSATGESTGSQTFALDQVPLASYFTYAPSGVSVGSSGGVSTVNITRYNSSYTHDVTWTFGSYSHTETGVGTSASWTIPATWLNAIPNSATGTCTVTLVTKSGSTPVGQAATAQFTITANVVPSYTNIVYSYRGPAYTAGITNALIAGYSQMRVAVSGAAGAYGSSVARMEFIKGTSTMATVNTSAASYTYDTPLLTAAETTTFTVRITDTRGKYVQQTSQSFTIKAYAMPSFTAASVYRSNSSGSPADDGTYIKITVTAAATPAENSITSLQYATKETTSSSWSADANIPSGAVSGYSNTTSYDVRLTATDKLGNKAYKYYTVPTQAFTMDFKVGGRGVAFGKVAEADNLVDSAWQIRSLKSTGDGLDAAIVVKSQNNAAIAAYNDTNANYIELCNGSSGNRGLYTPDLGWVYRLGTDNNCHIARPLDCTTIIRGNWTHGFSQDYQYQYIENSYTPSAANTWEDSSWIKLTAPVDGVYLISAELFYVNNIPTGIALYTSDSSGHNNYRAITTLPEVGLSGSSTQILGASCVAQLQAGETARIKGRYASAGSNKGRMRMWLL